MTERNETLEAELESLEAIFGNDFERMPQAKTAWNQYSPPSICITIHYEPTSASGDSLASTNSGTSIVLHVDFSRTYPKTCPTALHLKDPKGIKTRDVAPLEQELRDLSKTLQGAEMIFDLVLAIQDKLPKIATLVPSRSLDKERESRLAQQIIAREHQAQAEAQQRLEEEEKKAVAMRQKISLANSGPTSNAQTTLKLAHPIKQHILNLTTRASLHGVAFDAIELGVPIEINSLVGVYLTQLTSGDKLIIKKLGVFSNGLDRQTHKAAVSKLEAYIRQSLLQHMLADDRAVANIGYHVEHTSELTSDVFIIQPMLGSSAADILKIVHPTLEQARRWLIDLLDCIAVIHRQGRVHGRIKSSKVYFTEQNKEHKATLVDVGYLGDGAIQDGRLAQLIPSHRESSPLKGKNEDLARLLLVFFELCTGESDYASHANLEAFLNAHRSGLADGAFEFVHEALTGRFSHRLTSADLLNTPFMRGLGLTKEESTLSISNHQATMTQRAPVHHSRYTTDFDELTKLGQGGFGAVYKARNRLDGRLYAIKKIANFRENNRLLREVSGLARLNHAHIVRYFSAWIEQEAVLPKEEPHGFSASASFSDLSAEPDDFMSSSGFIQFAPDGISRGALSDISEHTASLALEHESTPEPAAARTLFIQMELCPHATLRDIIDRDEVGIKYWTYFGQITQAISYLHSQGLIHRDLKPANIFISSEGMLKLGDFGLATESQIIENAAGIVQDASEQTTEVGTFLYCAPEVAKPNASYDGKVDIYAMGVILAEIVCPWTTSMERVQLLRKLRRDPSCPIFDVEDKPLEARLISMMLQHDPRERPTAADLSEMLPPLVQRDQVANILKLVDQDPTCRSQVIAQLFSRQPDPVADHLYANRDRRTDFNAQLWGAWTIAHLTALFRAHGAIPRPSPIMLPTQAMYASKPNVARFIDPDGRLVQLPFDLSMPWARELARNFYGSLKTFSIGNVARVDAVGAAPRPLLEADFDIGICDDNGTLAFAEVLQMAQEIASMDCFNDFKKRLVLGHSTITNTLLELADFSGDQRKRLAPAIVQLARKAVRMSHSSLRRALNSEDLPDTLVQELLRLVTTWQVNANFEAGLAEVRQYLQASMTIACQSAIVELETLAGKLRDLGFVIAFDAFGGNGTDYYSINFRLDYGNSPHLETLCQGGFYHLSAAEFALPGEQLKIKSLVGFSLAVDKITRLTASTARSRAMHCFAMVAFPQLNKMQALLDLLRELWKLGVPTDYAQMTTPSTEEAHELAKSKGASYLIMFRERRHQVLPTDVLKVRSVFGKDHFEVALSDIPFFMLGLHQTSREIISPGQVESKISISGDARERLDIQFITDDEHRKMKLPQRQFIGSKATDALDALTKRLQAGDATVIVVDFDQDQLVAFQTMRVGQDASNRRALDKFDAQGRVHALGALAKLETATSAGEQCVFMYSFRTGQLVLLAAERSGHY
ncbi:hypothetical protein BCR37DRAFT_390038 [Protomyces lactucae-debilis]|uniref:non-specific serine/threonine protein kinase n=1 Tax=Protomyces lactucae-debilis TaxID=2754530 RepID=A0A1Y2EQ35_PROLT|nr:uncharacterized protein BCR37DRAFT_390038 [Protomyces lactucae-debilis]ORY73701.1 hypothetical protein BCR37DRAFT_390038 [Protomyces lactucae-debilis]